MLWSSNCFSSASEVQFRSVHRRCDRCLSSWLLQLISLQRLTCQAVDDSMVCAFGGTPSSCVRKGTPRYFRQRYVSLWLKTLKSRFISLSPRGQACLRSLIAAKLFVTLHLRHPSHLDLCQHFRCLFKDRNVCFCICFRAVIAYEACCTTANDGYVHSKE